MITVKVYKGRVAKWLDNLISRKFKQHRGALLNIQDNKPVGYCCLAVACETFNENQPKCEQLKINTNIYSGDYINHSVMPDKVAEWLGLTPAGAKLCVNMNDSQKKRFYQIKRELERHPEKYFHWAKKRIKNEK